MPWASWLQAGAHPHTLQPRPSIPLEFVVMAQGVRSCADPGLWMSKPLGRGLLGCGEPARSSGIVWGLIPLQPLWAFFPAMKSQADLTGHLPSTPSLPLNHPQGLIPSQGQLGRLLSPVGGHLILSQGSFYMYVPPCFLLFLFSPCPAPPGPPPPPAPPWLL